MLLCVLRDDDRILELELSGQVVQSELVRPCEPLVERWGPGVYGRAVLLGLAEVTLLDSAGIGWLLVCHKRVALAGGRLVLHSLPPLVDEVLRVVRLDQVFDLTASPAQAREQALTAPAEPAAPRRAGGLQPAAAPSGGFR